MKEKITNHDKLYKRKLHLPNSFLYSTLYHVGKLIFKKYNMEFLYEDDPRKEEGNIVLIANHASRNDFVFTALPLYPKKLNYVAAYNEFFRGNLAWILRTMQIIPKRQFYNDSYTVFEIISLVKKYNANICFFPEGLSTIAGGNQPCAPGTGKLLKFLNKPVYAAVTSGAYLLQPKYKFWKKERYGKCETRIFKVFDPEELKTLTHEEIEERVDKVIYNDDYEWAKKNNIVYKDNKEGIAEDLETLLYKCPKCDHEFEMETKGNIIRCKHCGNEAYIENNYTIHPKDETCKIPATQKKWFDYIRIKEREAILKDEDFTFEVETTLGVIPQDRYMKVRETAINVGEGKLILSRKNGFSYIGTMNNEPYEIHISNHDLYTFVMCYNCNIIHFFYKGELRQFTFKEKGMASKVLLLQNELHRVGGGEWQMLKDFKYDVEECFKD